MIKTIKTPQMNHSITIITIIIIIIDLSVCVQDCPMADLCLEPGRKCTMHLKTRMLLIGGFWMETR